MFCGVVAGSLSFQHIHLSIQIVCDIIIHTFESVGIMQRDIDALMSHALGDIRPGGSLKP